MANQTDTRDKARSESRGNTNQQNQKQSDQNTQTGRDQSRSNTQSSGSSSSPGSSSGQLGGIREGEPHPPEHTNAGNTGMSSDQTSPKTQEQQVPSRRPGSSGASEQDR